MFFDLQRFALIDNSTYNSVVAGTQGNDTITNNARGTYHSGVNDRQGAHYAKIYANDGDDVIDNRAMYVSIFGGNGNDSIKSSDGYARYVTIVGGAGSDTMTGSGSYEDVFQFNAGDGNDVITNYGSNDWIYIADGTSYSTEVSGADVVVKYGSDSITLKNAFGKTLDIFSGNYIANSTYNSVVSGTDSRDLIRNNARGTYHSGVNDRQGAHYAKIYAGNGDDIIDNRAMYVSIFGGTGNDSIKSSGGYARYATIDGGAGNDTIIGSTEYEDVFLYATGDGNDVIYNFESNDTLRITDDAKYSTLVSDADIVVRVGTGSIRLKNTYGKTLNIISEGGYDTAPATVPATVPADTTPADTTPAGPISITNTNRNSLVSGGSYNDTIQNFAGGVTVRGGAGNDFLFNSTNANYVINGGHGYVTIDGGDGNDTIKSINPHMSLRGGNGDDSIYSAAAAYITIKAGPGNDTILGGGSNKVIEYANGDGNDVITGINATDIIRITDGSSYSTVKSGSDVLVSIGSGAMTLKNAADKAFKVVGGSNITPVATVPADTVPPDTVPSGTNSSGTTLTMTLSLGSTGFTYSIDGDKVTLKDNGGQFSLTINGVKDFSGASNVFDLHDIDGIWDLASTITGGRGNDKLYGTDGVDTFIYSSGNDRIYNYGVEDRIVLADEITKVKVSGKNVKLMTDAGNLTVQKAVGRELTIVDADGSEATYVFTKQNRDLDSARITTIEELATEDYWFDVDTQSDPLDGLIENKNIDLGIEEITPKEFLKAAIEEITVSTRHRQQK